MVFRPLHESNLVKAFLLSVRTRKPFNHIIIYLSLHVIHLFIFILCILLRRPRSISWTNLVEAFALTASNCGAYQSRAALLPTILQMTVVEFASEAVKIPKVIVVYTSALIFITLLENPCAVRLLVVVTAHKLHSWPVVYVKVLSNVSIGNTHDEQKDIQSYPNFRGCQGLFTLF